MALLGPDADVGTAVVQGRGVPGVGAAGWVPGGLYRVLTRIRSRVIFNITEI